MKEKLSEKLDLKTQQKRMYEMLVAFDEFCSAHDIKYFLAAGTLLGAIRHKGFIPWDDDVDIFMMRDELNKLIKFDRVNDWIDIVTYDSKKYYHPYVHANLIDRKTIRKSYTTNEKMGGGKGIYVDIFALDKILLDKCGKNIYKKIKFLNWMRAHIIVDNSVYKNFSKRMLGRVLTVVLKFFFDPVELAKKVDSLSQMFNEDKQISVVSVVFLKHLVRLQKIDWFSKSIRWCFGDHEFSVPVDYDSVLKTEYGDYMRLPPVEDRECKHPADIWWR